MALGKQLNKILIYRGVSIKNLSIKTGIPEATLASLCRRDSTSTKDSILRKLAQALHVPLSYFFGDEDFQDMPRVQTHFRSPFDYSEYKFPEDAPYEDVSRALIAGLATGCMSVRVLDESMEPVYRKGDSVFINKTREAQIGQVGLFEWDGEVLVRVRGNGYLMPANPLFLPLTWTCACKCIGVAFGKATI